VVETIYDIRRAGIHIWMLTGDKKETAVNLAHSAGILRQEGGRLVDLCDTQDPRDTATLLEEVEGVDNLSLVIDGKSLTGLFRNPSSVKQLQALSMRCETVVACRLSPIQKSQLVRLVKGE
jgi:magnesium-transporting ATPase (P-type)